MKRMRNDAGQVYTDLILVLVFVGVLLLLFGVSFR